MHPDDWHHVVCPPSVRTWFRHFCSAPAERIHHVGEADADAPTIERLLVAAGARGVVFHSSHLSLLRDVKVAAALQARGVRVAMQSDRCCRLGVDKFEMKRFFADVGVPTPRPAAVAGGESDPTGLGWVVKHRRGTQSEGSRIVDTAGLSSLGPDEYAEAYLDGEEYSVVSYADEERFVGLPIVHKGRSQTDLLPPWRRQRWCPALELAPELESEMFRIAELIARSARCRGWLETEFIVGDDGMPFVLEINPRICGTMRIAALASRLSIFDVATDRRVRGRQRARGYATEVPWSGPTIVDTTARVFATSRLTVAGDSPADAVGKLAAYGAQATPAGCSG